MQRFSKSEPNNDSKEVFDQSKSQTEEKLRFLAQETEKPLYTTKSIFPFDFFPDILTIDRTKVTIHMGLFFFSHEKFPIVYQDIQTILVSTNLLFGSISFQLFASTDDVPIINYLPKNQAIKAGQIITGLIACHKEKLDLSKFTNQELMAKLEEIGTTKTEGYGFI